LRKVIELDPKNVVARARLAQVLVVQKHPEEAIAQLEAAAAADPTYAFAPMQIGVIHLGMGQRDQARAAFTRAVTIAPTFAPANFQLGQLLAEDGDSAAAIKYLDQALAADPLHVQAYYVLAQALRKSGREEDRSRAAQASAAFEKLQPFQREINRHRSVLNTSPNACDSLVFCAQRLEEIGRTDAALEHLNTALAGNSHSVAALKLRASLLSAQGKRSEARQDLELAVKLAPDDAEIAQALERLKP
jgi:tetratricopeptide (TPR) repeat protein